MCPARVLGGGRPPTAIVQSTHPRFVYPPKIVEELDRIAERCRPLGTMAEVTVGIQVYHNTRVAKEFIKAKGFHSDTKKGPDWHPFIESNDVQRYFSRRATNQWLQYSSRLHDKRELEHYHQPRILVQQIFWKRISSWFETPTEPSLYLNTLFAIYNPTAISLECILGILSSKFVSATYERRSNRLLGDKFPKVSKADLAAVPVPVMPQKLADQIGWAASDLQSKWGQFRADLAGASSLLSVIDPDANLSDFPSFWKIGESEFINLAAQKYGSVRPEQVGLIKECHGLVRLAVNKQWHSILSAETALDLLVKEAFGVDDHVYESLTRETPDPEIGWAMLAMR